MSENIPAWAQKITYDYEGISGVFHVWQALEGQYQWECGGQTGESSTMLKAMTAARTWALTGSQLSKQQ